MKKIIKKIFDVGLQNENNRNLWVEKTLKNLPAGLEILDAGAGESQYKKFCGHLKYTSQDFGEYDGKGNSSGLQTKEWDNTKLDIVSDIINIPVDDNSFDVILCTEVFEHLPDPVSAVKEFSRILRPGGSLIATAPFCSLTHFAPYHFSTGFNKYFYEHNLSKFNFVIKEITPNGNYFEYIAQEIRRIRSMAKEYSGPRWNFLVKLLVAPLLGILKILSLNDRGSSELLCFGYHVVAIRK